MVLKVVCLENVLYVEDLKANLLSISHICDQNLIVKFVSNKCHVFNNGKCILKGTISSNHCYQLIQSIICLKLLLMRLSMTSKTWLFELQIID